MAGLLGLLTLGVAACGELTPTSVDPKLLPEEPVTVEVRVPWDQFGSDLASFGGFGSPHDLGRGVVAHEFGGSLEARTLVALAALPTSATVRDTTGTQVTDDSLRVLQGRMMAVVDTLGSVADGPVTLQIGMVSQAWDPGSATWEAAVDSLGDTQAWTEAGGGPVSNTLTAVWDPAQGDTAVFDLDSAQVALWTDTASTNQGVRLEALSPGSRLSVRGLLLQADVQPSVNPDTTVVVTATSSNVTFLYTPAPPPPDGSIRVGGTPSWRTVLDVAVPTTLTGPAELCDAVGCPLTLTADQVSYAALVLRTQRSDPAFRPSDSVRVDVRPVFDRTVLPKSPLGSSLLSILGLRFAPELFDSGEGSEVEIPVTSFVRQLLSADTTSAFPPPNTLALLSTFEPLSLSYASFYGPGTPEAPVLKLIVTSGPAVELP
jgi:hypothetical protein